VDQTNDDMGKGTEFVSYWDSHSRCRLSPYLVRAYKIPFLRSLVLKVVRRLEGGRFFSQTLRDILLVHHGVRVGPYSYGGCVIPGYLPRGTQVGNYSSVSSFMRIYRRNHPFDRISTHPMFFNKGVGLLNEDSIAGIESNPLLIGHDVWIGHETVITPKCRVIGDGCVIGAGAIVTRDVEPFTIVGGNPAKLIRRRFSEDVEKALRESEWWLQPISRLQAHLSHFVQTASFENVDGLRKALQQEAQKSTAEPALP